MKTGPLNATRNIRLTPLFLVILLLLLSFSPNEWPISSVYPLFLVAFLFLLFKCPRLLDKFDFFFMFWVLTGAFVDIMISKNFSAAMYAIPSVLLLVGRHHRVSDFSTHFVVSRSPIIFLILLLGILSIFFVETHAGRYSLYYLKDPNYTSLNIGIIFVTFLLTGYVTARTSIQFVFLIGLLYSFTSSRMLVLASIIALFVSLLIARREKLSRLFVKTMLLISVLAQLIGFVLLKYFQELGLLDSSNLERLNAFADAFYAVLRNPRFFASGLGNVEGINEALNLINVPHNWFLMMWLSNGLVFSAGLFFIWLRILSRCDVVLLPPLAFLLVCGGILGRSPFFAPVLFVTFWYICSFQKRATHNNWRKIVDT